MEITNQVATLQDEVKLLKGEIKSILKEIRTAVLSRDNPFAAGMDALAAVPGSSTPSSSPANGQDEDVTPGVPELTIPPLIAPKLEAPATPAIPAMLAMPTVPAMPMMGQQPPPAVPAWAGAIPPQQPAPAPFAPVGGMAPPPAPAGPPASPAPPESAPRGEREASLAGAPADEASHLDQESPDVDLREDGDSREPIPIRRKLAVESEDVTPEAAPRAQQPSWSLPALAGLAVWAEDALIALGPRRFNFVLDLATFAELISTEAREVLSGLIDTDSLSHEEERPLNVNECLVVLRQLDAIVHGEKIVKLPRRRGIRHRRVR